MWERVHHRGKGDQGFVLVMVLLFVVVVGLVTVALLRQTSTSIAASFDASRGFSMKAPFPAFTSRTKACNPAASFFDSIDAVISGTDSTVAVTSRIE